MGQNAARYLSEGDFRSDGWGTLVRLAQNAGWRDLVAQAGLSERHLELLDKPMVFGPWADQQNVGDGIKRDLKSMLLNGSAAFRAFVRPQENNGDLDFILTEAVIIGVK